MTARTNIVRDGHRSASLGNGDCVSPWPVALCRYDDPRAADCAPLPLLTLNATAFGFALGLIFPPTLLLLEPSPSTTWLRGRARAQCLVFGFSIKE